MLHHCRRWLDLNSLRLLCFPGASCTTTRLCTAKFDDSVLDEHTVDGLKIPPLDVIEEWHIHVSLVRHAIMGNAHNSIVAVACSRWMSVAWFAHTLDLCTHDMNTTPGFQDFCSKGSKERATVRHHKWSPHASAKLDATQQATDVQVVQDVPTCQSSTVGSLWASGCYCCASCFHWCSQHTHCCRVAVATWLRAHLEANQRSHNVCMPCDMSYAIRSYPPSALYVHHTWKSPSFWRQQRCYPWKELATVFKKKIPQLQDNSSWSSPCTWFEVQRYLS